MCPPPLLKMEIRSKGDKTIPKKRLSENKVEGNKVARGKGWMHLRAHTHEKRGSRTCRWDLSFGGWVLHAGAQRSVLIPGFAERSALGSPGKKNFELNK